MTRFVDTSVLVRYLTGEPPDAAEAAGRLLDSSEDVILTDVALAESTYVLTSLYGAAREEVVDSLIGLIGKANITVFGWDDNLVQHGLLLCRPSGRVSITDALIWSAARSTGASDIYSLDRRFPTDGMTILEVGD